MSRVEIRGSGMQSVMRGKSNIIKTIMGLKSSWVDNQVMESKKRSSKTDK